MRSAPWCAALGVATVVSIDPAGSLSGFVRYVQLFVARAGRRRAAPPGPRGRGARVRCGPGRGRVRRSDRRLAVRLGRRGVVRWRRRPGRRNLRCARHHGHGDRGWLRAGGCGWPRRGVARPVPAVPVGARRPAGRTPPVLVQPRGFDRNCGGRGGDAGRGQPATGPEEFASSVWPASTVLWAVSGGTGSAGIAARVASIGSSLSTPDSSVIRPVRPLARGRGHVAGPSHRRSGVEGVCRLP